jgi:hypothetical protein
MEITARKMAKRELEEDQFTDLVHAWSPCYLIYSGLLTTMEITARKMAKRKLEEAD